MRSNFSEPLNLGQDRMISINGLADLIAKIADVEIVKKHIDGPMGVRGRNSDNSQLKAVLDWEPSVSLEEGLETTFNWILDEVKRRGSEHFIAGRG